MRNFLLNLLEKKTGKEWILPCLAVFDLSLKKHTWQLISAINIKSIFSRIFMDIFFDDFRSEVAADNKSIHRGFAREM